MKVASGNEKTMSADRYSDRTDSKRLAQVDGEILERMKGGYVECENPNDILYKFEGTMGLGGDQKDVIVPLNTDQMLLRGSSLRNTDFAYGLVVFTGHETKIMKNSTGSKAKFSKLEIATNTYIVLIVCLQFTISLVGAIFNSVWQTVYYKELDYYLELDRGDRFIPILNFIV